MKTGPCNSAWIATSAEGVSENVWNIRQDQVGGRAKSGVCFFNTLPKSVESPGDIQQK